LLETTADRLQTGLMYRHHEPFGSGRTVGIPVVGQERYPSSWYGVCAKVQGGISSLSHVIRYDYEPGVSYKSVQQISLLMEPPEGDPVADRGTVECTVTGSRNAEGNWDLRVDSRVLDQLQYLTPLENEVAEYTISDRGEMLSAKPNGPAVPFIVFSRDAVTLKDTWKSVESSLQKRVAMDHTLTTLEDVDGKTLAHVVTEGTSAGEPAVDYFAVRVVPTHHGHPIVGRTVVKYVWANGQTLSVVVEEKRI
jgi:hypothetical protein